MYFLSGSTEVLFPRVVTFYESTSDTLASFQEPRSGAVCQDCVPVNVPPSHPQCVSQRGRPVTVMTGVSAQWVPWEPWRWFNAHHHPSQPHNVFRATAKLLVMMVKEIDFIFSPSPFLVHQSGKILMGSDAIWVIMQKRKELPCLSKVSSELLGTWCLVWDSVLLWVLEAVRTWANFP